MSEQATNDKSLRAAKGKSLQMEILHLAGVLLIICTVCAGLLGWVNGITKDKIIAINQEKINAALSAVMPEAEGFQPVTFDIEPPAPIQAVWEAKQGDALLGLCVQVAPQGFGGPIVTIVGIDAEGAITGVQITSQTETAGLGTKTTEPDWLGQYAGLAGPLQLVKNVKSGDQDIVAVTAATISSRAVTDGVQAALTYGQAYLGGGQ